jgi:hypothetical protein
LFFVAVFVLSVASAELSLAIWSEWIKSQTVSRASMTGMYQAIALGATLPARLFSLIVLVLFGLPTFLGLSYGAWSFLKEDKDSLNELDVIKLSLLTLASSWFVWYLLLSVGWIRYLFPATLIGSMFLAKLLADLTHDFDVSLTLNRVSLVLSRGQFTRPNLYALIAVLVIGISVPRGLHMLYQAYFVEADKSVMEAAQFLNSQTAQNSLIETYDSELFFYLNRRYHFPEDQLHVELIRRTFLYEENRRINYDPLQSNPDYLVVGPQSKQWKLYDPVLVGGAFRLVRSYRRYQIYERVR